MADERFHKNDGPKTLEALCSLSGAALADESHAATVIEDVAPLHVAGAGQVSFLDNIKYKGDFLKTQAEACIVHPDMQSVAPDHVKLVLSSQPYKTYALIAQAFYPTKAFKAGRHETAAVAQTAEFDTDTVTIEAGAVIEDHVTIGAHSVVGANAVIREGVVIGENCRIGAGAVVSHSVIGDHVNIYPGCCIGQDGFGFAIDAAGFVKVPQLGRVVIGNGVEIGANTTIDRGAGPDTEIGDGTWIDNLVQIGHNVKIGRCCVIVSQVGISGSTVIEDFVMLGGQVGVAGHLKIGQGAKVAAKSGIMRDVEPGTEVMGSPAMPMKQFMRQIALLNRLIKKKKS